MTKENVLRIIELVKSANAAIMEIYRDKNLELSTKDDGSPVTKADMKSHNILLNGLKNLKPAYPILSEESVNGRDNPMYGHESIYWLIDPLDGTKEFIYNRPEFTVNIALIKRNRPVFGVVGVPANGKIYFGGIDHEAYLMVDHTKHKLEVSEFCWNEKGLVVLTSRSHLSIGTEKYLQTLNEPKVHPKGSSLKFLEIAEGKAHIYPRFGPTLEWDTAAAQAILEAAGGQVLQIDRNVPLQYNKPNLLNPNFVAIGRSMTADREQITAIIPTFNEEHNIREALESVLWADEIIVVDSFSTDQTPAIVKGFPDVTFVQHEYVNSATQKNWIIPQAKHDWIFLLDADERVTPELREEVLEVLASRNVEESAFWIKRQNYFLGTKLNYVWKSDAVIRLFRKSQCRYEDKAVHAEITTKGKVGKLNSSLEHHTYKDMEHFENKMSRYAVWSAQDYDKKTGKIGFYHLTVKPAYRFFKHYIIQGGVLDGKAGYTVSLMMAKGVKDRYVELQKMRNSKQH